MKAFLTSLLLSFALLVTPGQARADNKVQTPAAKSPAAELLTTKVVAVTGVSLDPLFSDFKGTVTLKAFVRVNGVLKAQVKLKGQIFNGVKWIDVEVDDVLIAVADLEVSCDFIKVHLGIFKVNVLVKDVNLNIKIDIRIDVDVVLIVKGSDCKDQKKLCDLAIVIHGKKHCAIIIKLLNEVFGCCDNDKGCGGDDDHGGGGGHDDDDDDDDCGCDDGHGGGGHGGGDHGHGGGGDHGHGHGCD